MQLRQVEVLLKSAVALTRTKLRWVWQVEVLLQSAAALTLKKIRRVRGAVKSVVAHFEQNHVGQRCKEWVLEMAMVPSFEYNYTLMCLVLILGFLCSRIISFRFYLLSDKLDSFQQIAKIVRLWPTTYRNRIHLRYRLVYYPNGNSGKKICSSKHDHKFDSNFFITRSVTNKNNNNN